LSQPTQNHDLFEFAKILGTQCDFGEVLRLVAHQSAQFCGADLALISMVNPDTRETVKTVIKDGKYSEQKAFRKIHTNVAGWILHYKKTFVSHDIHHDDRFPNVSFDEIGMKSVMGVPLMIEGIIIGAVILLYKKPSDHVNPDTLEYLENMAAISAPFLRNVQKIRQYFDSGMSDSTLLQKYKNSGLLGQSAKFVEMLHAVEAATKCDVRVLLDGKTGTGKELVARSIHQFSSRSDHPFIAMDCGAIPQNLLESELFGHKRGAFTGATSDRRGLFMEADSGTLFMDEINNLPQDMQSKLLRVLQEEEFRPVGSDKTCRSDIRIITASSIPLKSLVEQSLFREDLFFRLHVYPIYVPELSERREDIPLLANHFLNLYALQQNKAALHFHETVMEWITQRTWPGNIRELENCVERIITVTPANATVINTGFLPSDIKKDLADFRLDFTASQPAGSLKEQVDQYEAELIRKILIDCNWNQSKAARRLKISETNMRYKINQLGIQRNKT
jgi:transcriptional regulator with GAF, ATPase, and Fis domain